MERADELRRAVVSSVALSCLLTRDLVPTSKPPPVEEMVQNELPRVLRVIAKTQRLGGAEVELHDHWSTDAPGLLRRVCEAVTDLEKAVAAVREHGHEDMALSVLQYMRKPPTASAERIRRVTAEVAEALGVDIPDTLHEQIGDAYDATHGMLIRV